ncbi:putative DNA modification/repair radical SAM protein [Chiayiivirga flava]|uniref:Putative DNA modification/repair radical SAM protein n=1 Tax=Chiayiivirga flava TaxID=659595 RepID=A0A7W8D7J7_9GAMM|nr:putative DNA modification/repair radical SAM protein [Chiayiivirga flava]MBB5208126.1 putative DNA modification/repair radical SAM protein [Chiayiivirga flava]
MDIPTKLAILADAAKYDASCSSSGGPKRDAGKGGLGSTGGAGICHSYAPDGRCISLLKILLTNFCLYDCTYCINRRSSNVQRARFTPEEVVELTLSFYRRNYIEGLFLSSGIIRNPDYTMEQVVEVARKLRVEHRFRGYIHLKTIPDASPELLAAAGKYADRLSINVELPTEHGLAALAPEKNLRDIRGAMGRMRLKIDEAKEEKKAPRFAPAGQSTQMIVGADAATDRDVLASSTNLYANYQLKRVYYSAFSPIPDSALSLPLKPPPLMREHRLYQADWLLRFYGFDVEEIAPSGESPMLSLDIDPKLAWALRHRDLFPVDINRAAKESLLRIPGLGVRNVKRIVQLRKLQQLRLDDLARLRAPLRKMLPFIITADHTPGLRDEDTSTLRARLAPPPKQGGLFDA